MQSDIFKYAVSIVRKELIDNSVGKYSVVEEFANDQDNQVKISVPDLFQASNDKTGQRIIVDEKRYEVPALYIMNLRIEFNGKTLEDILSNYGFVAAYFKDHNNYECGEYNWHGNENGKFFLEPVVRKEGKNGQGYLYLEYRIELQINSNKEESFVRVEKKDLRTNQI